MNKLEKSRVEPIAGRKEENQNSTMNKFKKRINLEMKKRTFFSLLFVASVVVVQAATSLPQGQWKTIKVTVEKTIDGNLETMVYNSPSEVQSRFRCPQMVEVKSQTNMVFHYPQGGRSMVVYSLEGSELTVRMAAAVQVYQYNVSATSISLTIVRNYVNNLPDGRVERTKEKQIIILEKQI